MIVVAMMACRPVATFAIGRFGGSGVDVLQQEELPPRETAALLVPKLFETLRANGLDWQSVSAVAVSTGPGSFTGVRVGLATAEGLVESRNLPLLAVSSLAVAQSVAAGHCVVLDAGRGELYARNRAGDERLITALDLNGFAAGGPVAAFESAVAERVPGARFSPPLDASALLRFATPRLAAGERSDTAAVDANYLRASAAEARASA